MAATGWHVLSRYHRWKRSDQKCCTRAWMEKRMPRFSGVRRFGAANETPIKLQSIYHDASSRSVMIHHQDLSRCGLHNATFERLGSARRQDYVDIVSKGEDTLVEEARQLWGLLMLQRQHVEKRLDLDQEATRSNLVSQWDCALHSRWLSAPGSPNQPQFSIRDSG